MAPTSTFEQNVAEYEQWYIDHPEVYDSEVKALQEQFAKLSEDLRGIEIGLGTGRFSIPLGIKEGIEPSMSMAEKAVQRGIEVMPGVAEQLPYGDLQFDFVLFVTICFLDDLKLALKEVMRVLKPNGAIIIGFLDKDQAVAKEYMEKRNRSKFYKEARFYSVKRIHTLLSETGFVRIEYNQTLFGEIDSIKEVQLPIEGHGKGSFVVVKAHKK